MKPTKKLEHLSKSSIKNYIECPFKFYCQNLVGITGVKPYAFVKGNEIHDTLHEAIVFKKQVKDFPQQVNFVKSVFKKLEPWSLVVAEKRLNATYIDLKLVGLMDIVVKTVGDRIIILDYKSGKEYPFSGYRFELGIYYYILKQNGIIATHWGIIFTDQNIVKIEPVKLDKVNESIAKAYQVWTEINDKKFDRKISTKCNYCPLKDSCDIIWYQYKNEIVN